MEKTYPVPDTIARTAKVTSQQYNDMYARSLENPDEFWGEHGQRIDWFKPYTKVKNASFDSDVSIKWYEDGALNACYNCVDRHLPQRADQTALIFEDNDPDAPSRTITYAQLKDEVSKLANALKSRGVKKGDRVTIYMPMIPEAVMAMLACARIGAVHSVVFGGFSPEALRGRILDGDAHIVITADEAYRGNKTVPLKANTDKALEECPDVHTVLVFKRTGGNITWNEDRDIWWHDLVDQQSTDCPCEEMNAEDPLFILYTSGSTGKPKGVLHTTGGYMVYASMTHEYVFDLQDDDIYWCTADVGWITGHSYITYGPLANGATQVIFEGIPTYPDVGRFWQVVEKHKVSIFYTAPTAIRSLLGQGNDAVKKYDRSSLRILGSVGEPINTEAWQWYYDVVGESHCPIVDTWWQTETGGIALTPLPGAHALKPGYAMKPFFGIRPVLLNDEGRVQEGRAQGNLCLTDSWPGQMRTVYGDHDRFIKTYFSDFPGYYFSGDGALRDQDGDLRISGRTDDVLKISGHRLGTAEIESALDEHPKVAEAAIVGCPHPIKGQGIYAYVTLKRGFTADEQLEKELNAYVREKIGPIASLDVIQWAPGLPKTRSGKIMRRILRKIAAQETDQLGDTSTLADPEVVDNLIKNSQMVA